MEQVAAAQPVIATSSVCCPRRIPPSLPLLRSRLSASHNFPGARKTTSTAEGSTVDTRSLVTCWNSSKIPAKQVSPSLAGELNHRATRRITGTRSHRIVLTTCRYSRQNERCAGVEFILAGRDIDSEPLDIHVGNASLFSGPRFSLTGSKPSRFSTDSSCNAFTKSSEKRFAIQLRKR